MSASDDRQRGPRVTIRRRRVTGRIAGGTLFSPAIGDGAGENLDPTIIRARVIERRPYTVI
jgi:hypothetical protein